MRDVGILVAALLLLPLAACSGGGSKEQSSPPSTDLLSTHPWLYNYYWNGATQSNTGGQGYLSFYLTDPLSIVAGDPFRWSAWVSFVPGPTFAAGGWLIANGSNVSVTAIDQWGRVFTMDFVRVETARIVGTFRLFAQIQVTEAAGSLDLLGTER